jgi:periplasmic protein CpxP/Spy
MMNISSGGIRRFLVAAILSLSIPLVVKAAPEFLGMGAEEMGGVLHGLSLSEAQHDQVFKIMHAQAPLMREKSKALRKAEDNLRRLATSADFSEASAKLQADALARAMSEVALLRIYTDHQVFELLSAEQRQQLAECKNGKGSPVPEHRPPCMGGDGLMLPH